ncbi:ABC transporter ATP-binding protein [Methylobrevis pamukkalensis]|uniref:Spermidine/putrescine import ATP-binding protein PotA n=1 Tax=Methylobrevis pamukkalensis TaxID=1439726 RepID=A0A1E3GZX9_9HYPH|nr:ABC transporter ATP-binding protein [Methylobrevis pamukkalensis]ODN69619.1 Spermidine/putrescine import ATP-binding protein PotA [Methylobrevis pamukkalensis]
MAKTLGPVKRSFAPWNDPAAKPYIQYQGITKRFGDFVAVKDLDLTIYEREFFALLGPSGCGKTTLMRMLAGFEEPTEGRILLDGQDMAGIPPYRRPTNMMFQSYALFPHMDVTENIAFGLKQDKLPKGEIDARVQEMLKLVKLEPFAKRKPHQMSGGQRQRVALARSLAKRPKVLLLDEPLGALDKKLREETQFELTDLQYELGMTFIIVTHDQEEAMTLADRIAVMDKGKIVQVATPAEIYEEPNTRYVADFIGNINILDAGVTASSADATKLTVPGIPAAIEVSRACPASVGDAAFFAIRPEKMHISLDRPVETTVNALQGEIWDIAYLGDVSIYHVRLDNGSVVKATVTNATRLVERPITWHDKVWLTFARDAGLVLTA